LSDPGVVVQHPLCGGSPGDIPLTLRPGDADSEAFLLHRDGRLGLYFTPFDWVNVDAVVTLVGLTPGRRQAHLALTEVVSALREGRSVDEALRRADSAASFAGSMRTNLVKMLDAIGLVRALSLRSTESLVAGDARLVTSASAILYPVCIDGRNYSGSPQIAASPAASPSARPRNHRPQLWPCSWGLVVRWLH
jgi:hypothetical protein